VVGAGDLSLGTITALGTGSTINTGNIVIENTTPAIVGSTVAINSTTGQVTSGSFSGGVLQDGKVNLNGVITAGSLFSVNAGDSYVNTANVTAPSIAIATKVAADLKAVYAGNNFTATVPILVVESELNFTGSVALVAGTSVDIRNHILAPGGILIVSKGDVGITGSNIFVTAATTPTSKSGDAGSLTIVAGANFTQTATNVVITGASGFGGDVNLGADNVISTESIAAGPNGFGGNITLVAYAVSNSSNTGGHVVLGPGTQALSGGNNGANGNITMVANGLATGTGIDGINYGGLIDTTSGTAGTGTITLATTLPGSGVTLSKTSGGVALGTFLGGVAGQGMISATASGELLTQNADISLTSGGTAAKSISTLKVSAGSANVRMNALNGGIFIGSTIQGGSIVGTGPGEISVRGDLSTNSFKGGILLVSGSDITSFNAPTLNTKANGGSGSISMIAGATYTQDATSVTITGGTNSGGNVDISSITALSTDATSTGSGGDINLIAFADKTTGAKGIVATTNSLTTLRTGALVTGTNGNITIIGAANQGGLKAVDLAGTLDSTNSIVGSGNISLLNQQIGTGVVLSKTSGNVTNGTFVTGITKGAQINSSPGQQIDAGGTLTVDAGNLVNLSNGTLVAQDARISSGTNVQVGPITTTGSTVITAQNQAELRGSVFAKGGLLVVAGADIQEFGANAINTSNATGSGGAITFVAGAAFTSDANNITITGSSASGGNVDLRGELLTITSRGLGANASGGDINLIAYAKADGTKGTVSNFNNATTLLTGGTGSGANGDAIFVAGNNQNTNAIGDPGNPVNVNTTGGLTGTGDIFFAVATPNSPVTIAKATAVPTDTFLGGTLRNGNISLGTITTTGTVSQAHAQSFNIGPINAPTASFRYETANAINVNGAINVLGLDLLATSINVGFNITGQKLSFDSQNGITAFNAGTLTVSPDGGGNGGQLAINASNVTWASSGTSPLVLDTSGSTGLGGTLSVTLTDSSPVSIGNVAGAFDLKSTGGQGSINFTANNATLTVLDGARINVTAGTNRKGGDITLSAKSLVGGTVGGPTLLNAAGNGTGGGGAITLKSTQTTPFNIAATQGSFSLNAAGGTTGAGGAISVETANNLTVDPATLIVTPGTNGKGGSISLSAIGNLLVTGPLNVAGNGTGAGGSINLVSSSATDFNVGKPGANGVKGALNVSGSTDGSVSIRNLAGGIAIGTDLIAVGSAVLTADAGSINLSKTLGGTTTASIDLNASESIFASKAITGDTVSLTATNGDVGGKKAVLVSTELLDVTAGQAINVSNTRTGELNLAGIQGGAASSVQVTSAGDIIVSSDIIGQNITLESTNKTSGKILVLGNITANTTSGVVNLTASGAGKIYTTNALIPAITGFTVNLASKSGTIGDTLIPLKVAASNLSIETTGDVDVTNQGTIPLTLTSATSAGNFNLSSMGDLIVAASLKSAQNITLSTIANNGDITFNASQGGKNANKITADAVGSGQILQSSTKVKLTAGEVNLSSDTGNIGGAISIATVAGALALNTGGSGNVTVVDSSKGVVNLLSSSAGGNFNLSTAAGVTLNNLSADTIAVTNAKGLLSVANGANVSTNSTTDGSILLRNSKAGKGVQIAIGAGASIISNSTAVNGGRVDIIIGVNPPPQVDGTTPANVTVNETFGGQVYFNTGITASAPNNVLTAKGTTLTFNADKAGAGAITLGGGVTITADPTTPYVPGLTNAPVFEGTNGSADRQTTFSGFSEPTQLGDVSISTPALNSSSFSSFNPQSFAYTNLTNIANYQTPGLTTNAKLSDENSMFKLAEIETLTAPSVTSLYEGSNHEAVAYDSLDAFIWSDEDLGFGNSASVIRQQTGSGTVRSALHNVGAVESANLRKGAVVMAPSRDTRLDTPFGVVEISKGSVALVVVDEHRLGVYDLHDSHKASIKVTSDDHQSILSPGHCAVLTHKSQNAFSKVNPLETVKYRGLTSRALSNGKTAFHAEFSPLSAINTMRPLMQLCASKHAGARRVSSKLMKTIAVLMQLSGSGNGFQTYTEPSVTAMK